MKNHVKNNNNSLRVLGILIRYNRLKNHLSLRDLAKLTNISHTLISNIEKGKVVPASQTLADIFKVLKLEYNDYPNLSEEFQVYYDRIFELLVNLEYNEAKIFYDQLIKREDEFRNSPVIIEYTIIKYFYLVLTNTITVEDSEKFEVFNAVLEHLSDEQKQFAHFIRGLDLMNNFLYYEASLFFKQAMNIGDTDLDSFIKLHLVFCHIRMYNFMDALEIANDIIVFFEDKLNYVRAMQARLYVAFAYILVSKIEQSQELIDKVYKFAIKFNVEMLIEDCNYYYCYINLKQSNLIAGEKYHKKLTRKNHEYYFFKLQIALLKKDFKSAKAIYKEAIKQKYVTKSSKLSLIYDIFMKDIDGFEISDEEYLKKLYTLADLGKRGKDLVLLLSVYARIIRFYKSKRQYKSALEASEEIREYRNSGVRPL